MLILIDLAVLCGVCVCGVLWCPVVSKSLEISGGNEMCERVHVMDTTTF